MSDFTNIDSTTPLLNQQRQQVIRVGGKEVVQHDVAAVEAVGSTFNLKLHIFELPSDFQFSRNLCSRLSPPLQQFQQEQLHAFVQLESDLVGLAEVYQEVATLTVEQGVALDQVCAAVWRLVDGFVLYLALLSC